MKPDAILERHVAAAVERHRDLEPAVRAVAAELSPRARCPWVAMADALARGDVAAATAAAAADPRAWLPLVATAPGDPRLFGRLLEAAARPAEAVEHGWTATLYPLFLAALALGLAFFLSVTVLPVYEQTFTDFDMELPVVTRWVLATAAFVRSIWKPLLVGAGLVLASRWLFRWWSRRSAAVAAAFTRSLARLVEGDVPQADALALAARGVGLAGVNAARPRRPLAHAAVAALDYEPPTTVALLDAVADCHAERAMRSRGAAAFFMGPLAICLVGFIYGAIFLGLLLPLVRLINDLS